MSTTATRPEAADAALRRRKRRTVLVLVCVVVVVTGAAFWIVAFSSLLGVRTVTVRGTQVLTPAQVRAAAAIRPGTPLVRIDTAAVARRVEKLAVVASAQVSTSMPSTVTITVEERQPIGYIRSGSGVVLVDRTGDQYRTLANAPQGLPLFVVPGGTDSRTTGGAVATVAASLGAGLRTRVRSIEALDPNAITLVLRGGSIINWGSSARSEEKARVVPALLQRGAAHIDVTNPDQPFTH